MEERTSNDQEYLTKIDQQRSPPYERLYDSLKKMFSFVIYLEHGTVRRTALQNILSIGFCVN